MRKTSDFNQYARSFHHNPAKEGNILYYAIDVLSDASERVPYNHPAFPLYAGRGRISSFRDRTAASHWHDDLEFSVVLSGAMRYCVNGEHVLVHAGEGVFINARQVHHNYEADAGDCQYLCVLVHPSLFCQNPFVRDHFAARLLGNGGFPFAVLRAASAWQAELMAVVQALLETCLASAEPDFFTLQSLAYRAVAILFQRMPEEKRLSPQVDRRLSSLRNMVGYIQAHYEERLSLDRIAAAGQVSQSTCCAIFRHQLQQTPISYLNRYRLEKALGLMTQPELSITEIAYAVGFASASYFAETFHKHFGLSPSEHRAARA